MAAPGEFVVLFAVEKTAGGFLADANKRDLAQVFVGPTLIWKVKIAVARQDHPIAAASPCRLIGTFAMFKRTPCAPLLKEEVHAGGVALIANGPRPIRMHWPGARAAFSAYDDPIDLA